MLKMKSWRRMIARMMVMMMMMKTKKTKNKKKTKKRRRKRWREGRIKGKAIRGWSAAKSIRSPSNTLSMFPVFLIASLFHKVPNISRLLTFGGQQKTTLKRSLMTPSFGFCSTSSSSIISGSIYPRVTLDRGNGFKGLDPDLFHSKQQLEY